MMEPTPRRLLACLLAALGVFVSVTFILASPARLVGEMEVDGKMVEIGSRYLPGAIVLMSVQAVAAVVLIVGVIAAVFDNRTLATRSFGVAVIVGLIPTIVPGVLAFVAWRLVAPKPA